MTDKLNELPRRFYLERDQDISGKSGTGIVAFGVEWNDGSVVLHWNSEIRTTTVFNSIEDVAALHGHDGATKIVWLDNPKSREHYDASLWSNVSLGSGRMTWEELSNHLTNQNKELQRFASILHDLDRCEHGRHRSDICGSCGDENAGNIYLRPDRIIGTTISGHKHVVPLEGLYDPEAWEQAQIKRD